MPDGQASADERRRSLVCALHALLVPLVVTAAVVLSTMPLLRWWAGAVSGLGLSPMPEIARTLLAAALSTWIAAVSYFLERTINYLEVVAGFDRGVLHAPGLTIPPAVTWIGAFVAAVAALRILR